MILAPLVLLLCAAPHPGSISSSRVVIDGTRAEVRLRCQLLSLVEVIDGLDADGDGQVTEVELDAREAEVEAYVGRHYRLFVGSGRDLQGGVALTLEGFTQSWLAPENFTDLGSDGGGAEFEFQLVAQEEIRDLMLEVTLFHDTSPDHVDLATLHWPSGTRSSFGVTREYPRARSDPSGRGVFGAFLKLGFDHILSGWDHLAFVVVLLLGARSVRSLLGIVTAFTVAHSVTLGLSATKLVDFSAYTGLVELVIALSIAYMAVDNLLRDPSARSRWLEAFAFGLIHGLGFAGFLGQSLVGEEAQVKALLSFNVGVELGQLLVVAIVLVLLFPVIRRKVVEGAKPALVPVVVRTVGSVAVAGLGLFWFVERI